MNPFHRPWTAPFGLPPFDAIEPGHFRPAFDRALEGHRAAVGAIARDSAAPTFENTIEALERSFEPLNAVSSVFHVLIGAHTDEALEKVNLEVSPLLARHYSELYLDTALYRRVDALHRQRDDLGLTEEQRRVLERYHLAFVREGAALGEAARARLTAISERLALLGTHFGQNVLADEKSYTLELDPAHDLAGLPDFVVGAAAAAGDEHKQPGKYLVTLSRSSIEPFLTFSERRDLRETAWKAWTRRGDNGDATDNKAIIAETVRLREERAKLLGYRNYADFRISDEMAKTPENARGMLEAVWPAARATAMQDRDALRGIAQAEGQNDPIAPWDWRYYAEKLRKARYAIDTAEVKPYLQLEKIIEAAFYTAGKLFGLSFRPLADAKLYHPDARAWEVLDRAGKHVGVFIGDYFARPSKRSGAWMTSLREQAKLDGATPVILNVMNFSKADEGAPALLSYDDARTLFHEFGHGLHGLLSDVTYPVIAGTSVATDFVELPSQLYEHWLETPEVLGRFAVHAETGQPMPKELLDRVLAARNFDQGFATVEYLASALVDLDFHTRPAAQVDATAFEREALERIDMPSEMVMRHRSPHFAHIFSGSGYASAYYSYMWSEMLDADAFAAFKEAGDIFDPATAKRLHDFVYSAGNKRDPAEAYLLFRGSMPKVDAVLRKRGLSAAA